MKLKSLLSPPLSPISLAIVGLGITSLPASAAWFDKNLRDGMSGFSVGATVAPSFTSSSSEFRYLAGDDRIGTALQRQDKQESDERTRLTGGDSGLVWISAYQNITRNITADTTVLLAANPRRDNFTDRMVAWGYGVNLRHSKFGSIGVNSGRQFSTSSIGVSGTYNLLDTQSSVVSANYTQIPNLTVAGYYAFPASQDVREVRDTALHSGYGLTASYVHSFNSRHALTGAIGYTDGERHMNISSNSIAKNKEALMAGLRYQYQDWTVSVDGGRSDEVLDGKLIDEVKTDAFGVRVDYEVTPRINVYASYGERNSKKKPTTGNALTLQDFVVNNLGVNESLVFNKVEQKRYSLGATYDLSDSVEVIGSVAGTQTKNYLAEGPFSERETLTYSAGFAFSF